ncbi:MAG: PLP-dependent aminotransferase family protein [Bacteroidota bacterium]
MTQKPPLYQQISQTIEHHIKTEVLKTGDKLPSLRSICHEYGVSMSTALQSYFLLESKSLIESRPQSGYYVSYAYKHALSAPTTSSPVLTYGMEEIENIIATVSDNAAKSKILFSMGTPALELLPVAKLNKAMLHAMRHLPDSGVFYSHQGNTKLKQQIAKRAMIWGGKLNEHDITTTSGCMDALAFCLIALTTKGDTIVVESPIFFGILQLAKSLGLNIIELPTNAVTGVEIDALKKVLEKKKIKLCLLVSNFSNPVGSCMPTEHKKEVVKLMEKHNVPLIEDDLYGDIYFGNQRPSTCKAFDESGIVLWCGSFSKTLASGYRVGWVAPGKFKEKLDRTKRYHSVSTNTLAHEAIAHFMENDRYDAHLRKLSQTLYSNLQHYLRCIAEYFPAGTRVSKPDGGFILWVELNKNQSSLKLYDQAIQHKINISPGSMYTLQQQYDNCFRLNFGLKWNDKVEAALKLLGKLAHQQKG